MVVAPRTFHGESKHGRSEGVHTVRAILDAELLLHAAPFIRLAMETIEGRGDALFARGVGQQIASDLPRQKFIVGEILVERLDDPVAIRRNIALHIALVTIGVGITREVEPVQSHAFTVGRRVQIFLRGTLDSVWRFVRKQCVNLRRIGWKSCKIKRETAQNSFARSRWRRRQFFLFQTHADKGVNGIERHGTVLECRHDHFLHREESPMRFVICAFEHPAFKQFLFCWRQREMRIRGRHYVVFVLSEDAADQFAMFRVAGFDDCHSVFEQLQRSLALIEAQLCLARRRVRAVTAEAAIRKQRPDLKVEINPRRCWHRRSHGD